MFALWRSKIIQISRLKIILTLLLCIHKLEHRYLLAYMLSNCNIICNFYKFKNSCRVPWRLQNYYPYPCLCSFYCHFMFFLLRVLFFCLRCESASIGSLSWIWSWGSWMDWCSYIYFAATLSAIQGHRMCRCSYLGPCSLLQGIVILNSLLLLPKTFESDGS